MELSICVFSVLVLFAAVGVATLGILLASALGAFDHDKNHVG